MSNHELIITGRHVDLTETLKAFIHGKTEKLFRHETRIVRIRVDIEADRTQNQDPLFKARGIIEINGPDLIASEASDDMHKSIDLLVNKLDRMIRRRSRLQKVKRKHPHAVEIPAELPKVATA